MNKHLISIACVCLLSACGGGGGDSSPTSVPQSSPTTFSISSTSYANNGVIPTTHACAAKGGTNQSPQLSIANLPSDAAKLAIVMDDEVSPCGTGSNACVHWAVFNLPSTKTTFTAGEDLVTTVAGATTYGTTYLEDSTGYAGPCPPTDHVYKLTVFALKASAPTIPMGQKLTRSTFASTYASNIVGQATWTGRYPK